MFSKQKVFCNACGKELFIEPTFIIGQRWRCCTVECNIEMCWREALSLMGKEYMEQTADMKKLAEGVYFIDKKDGNGN